MISYTTGLFVNSAKAERVTHGGRWICSCGTAIAADYFDLQGKVKESMRVEDVNSKDGIFVCDFLLYT